MVQAIGSATVSGGLGAGAATASLEAQLVRYQKQLSDCVNCDSAKTAEGKAAIDALSSKISEVRTRIDTVTKVKSRDETTSFATSTSTHLGSRDDAAIPASVAQKQDASLASTPKWTTATVGSRVDVQA